MYFPDRTLLERIAEEVSNTDFLRKAATSPHLGYVAQVTLDSPKIKERAATPWEYKPYIEFVEEQFVLRRNSWWASSMDDWRTHVAREFSETLALEAYCSVKGFGPALYVSDEKGNYREAGDSDADYAFIKRMFIEEGIGLQDLNVSRPPVWAQKLYLYRPNWDAYQAIAFQWPDSNEPTFAETTRLKQTAIRWLTEGARSETEEIRELKKAIEHLQIELAATRSDRAACNDISTQSTVPTDTSASNTRLSFRYETRALRLVADVQERYLGQAFNPNDPDTRPAKSKIMEWLRNEKGVASDVEAGAIDRVAMPFSRGK